MTVYLSNCIYVLSSPASSWLSMYLYFSSLSFSVCVCNTGRQILDEDADGAHVKVKYESLTSEQTKPIKYKKN